MLKQYKIITPAPTCFGSRRNHHQGAILWFIVLVGIPTRTINHTL